MVRSGFGHLRAATKTKTVLNEGAKQLRACVRAYALLDGVLGVTPWAPTEISWALGSESESESRVGTWWKEWRAPSIPIMGIRPRCCDVMCVLWVCGWVCGWVCRRLRVGECLLSLWTLVRYSRH